MEPLKFLKIIQKNKWKQYKFKILLQIINKLTNYHYKKSKEYKKILDGLNYNQLFIN